VWREAEQAALRIEVKRTGLYRIPTEDLPLEGLGARGPRPGRLRLTCQGLDVPMRVACANGRTLAPGDYLEFYGQALDAPFTDTNVYCLSLDGTPSRPMGSRNGSPRGRAVAGTPAYPRTSVLEENHVWWSLTPGAPPSDAWFWEKLTAPAAAEHTFTLPAMAAGPAALRVLLQGATAYGPRPDHHTRILVNGVLVSDERWDGQAAFVHHVALPEGVLRDGANTLAVELPGDTGTAPDAVYLDRFEVDWASPIQASDDVAAFSVEGAGGGRIQVSGFTGPDIVIYDVTDPGDPCRVTGAAIAMEGGSCAATFQSLRPGLRRYWASTARQCLRPAAVDPWVPSGLRRDPNLGADYILITPRAFLAAAEPLRSYRQGQGLRAMSVAVEDIYTAFSGGVADPQAIRDFLAHARQNWVPPAPSHVLLLGDATTDYRGFTGGSKRSLVPLHFSRTEELGLTPDDTWYVTPEGAEFPAMNIGRLPAATPEAAAAVVNKILAYERSPEAPLAQALLVADNADLDFLASSERISRMLPGSMALRKVYMQANTDPQDASRIIRETFQGGPHLVVYVGHGQTTYWTRHIFQNQDVGTLLNSPRLPLVLSFACLVGYFGLPDEYSLGETLVSSPAGGAVAVLASSGLG
jgi:hypothetical protein